MRQPTLIFGILFSALNLVACSDNEKSCRCETPNAAGECELSSACTVELQRAISNCGALDMTFETGDTSTPTYLRPAPALNPNCTTWLQWNHELSVDADAPYLSATTGAPLRCNFQNITVPTAGVVVVNGSTGVSFKIPRQGNAADEWRDFTDQNCHMPADEAPEFMKAGEPCLSACTPGTMCNGDGEPLTHQCVSCTTSPCEGFYSAAFCDSGAQLGYEALPETIFDRLGVAVPAEAGLRQLLQEVMACGAPLELTLDGEDASVDFLRGQGVVFTGEAPDRGITWAVLRTGDDEGVYRCDFRNSSELWQTVTVNESGAITNFQTLQEEWLPHCEVRSTERQALHHACLNVDDSPLRCADGLICNTQALRPTNLVGRIGYCDEQP